MGVEPFLEKTQVKLIDQQHSPQDMLQKMLLPPKYLTSV